MSWYVTGHYDFHFPGICLKIYRFNCIIPVNILLQDIIKYYNTLNLGHLVILSVFVFLA